MLASGLHMRRWTCTSVCVSVCVCVHIHMYTTQDDKPRDEVLSHDLQKEAFYVAEKADIWTCATLTRAHECTSEHPKLVQSNRAVRNIK